MNRLLRFCLLTVVLTSLGYTQVAFADPNSRCGIYEIGETNSAVAMWGIQPPFCNDIHLVDILPDPPYVKSCQAGGAYGFRVVCRPDDITKTECYADASSIFCGTYESCDFGYRKDTLDNYVYYDYNAAAGLEICVPCDISSTTTTTPAGGGTTIKTIITKSYTHADCIGTPDQPAATYACAPGYHINPERGAPTNDTDECDADCSTDETCTGYTDTGTPGYQQATCTTLNTDCTVAATRTIYQCTPNTYLGNAVMTNGVLGGCCENKETCADTWVDDGEGREKKACSRPDANCANVDTSKYQCKTGYAPETAGITDSSLVCKIQCNVGTIACDEYEPVTLNGQSGYERHLCGILANDCTRPNTYYEYQCAANYHNTNDKHDETIVCEQDCSTNEQTIDCTQNSDYCNSVNAPRQRGYVLIRFKETKNANCTVNTQNNWEYECDILNDYEGTAVYDANTNEFSGCKIKNNCTAGQYYDPQNTEAGTNVCKQCPENFPNSDAGDNDNQNRCYKTCPTLYFVNGEWTTDSAGNYTGISMPDEAKVFYNTLNTGCVYPNPQCNDTGGMCNMGYHLDNTTKECVENVINTNCGNNELSFFDTDTQEYSQCYIQRNSCNTTSNNKFYSMNNCNGVAYGICAAAQLCTENGTLTAACVDGTIDAGGLIFPDATGQYKDFSKCRCTKSNVPLLSDSKQIGTATIKYKFADDGSLGAVETTTVTSCVLGYCRPNDTDTTCTETAIGYYSDENTGITSMRCKACPAGATTAGTGSTTTSQCYYTSSTVFEDNGGTFTIPGTNFNIKWTWWK